MAVMRGDFWEVDVPPTSIVLAIIEHESQGNERLCKDETDGSSSRGLMQINRKHSKCGDEQWEKDFSPWRNIRIAVFTLAIQSKWHRECHHNGHDPLIHYAGKGPKAVEFAKEIRRIADAIEKREVSKDHS